MVHNKAVLVIILVACLATVVYCDVQGALNSASNRFITAATTRSSLSSSQGRAKERSDRASSTSKASEVGHFAKSAAEARFSKPGNILSLQDLPARDRRSASSLFSDSDLPSDLDSPHPSSKTFLDKSKRDSNAQEVSGFNTRAAVSVSFVLTDETTNATLFSLLCAQLNTSVTSVSIRSNTSHMFTIPSCISTSTSLQTIFAANLILVSFRDLPSSTTSLILITCIFTSGEPSSTTPVTSSTPAPASGPTLAPGTVVPATLSPPSSTTGFDASSNIVWSQVWTILPSLTSISLSECNIRGSLPISIPSVVTSFTLRNNRFPLGSIRSTILGGYTGSSVGFTLILDGCGLTGTIPSGLFAFATGSSSIAIVSFSANNNSISSQIPATLFQPFASVGIIFFSLSLTDNQLNGTIPTSLFPSGMMIGDGGGFTLDLSSNRLNGPLSANLFSGLKPGFFYFRAANNPLGGSIPAQLLGGLEWINSNSMVLDLSTCELSGPIPSDLITSFVTQNITMPSLSVNLGNNSLNGTIPDQMMKYFTSAFRSTSRSSNLIEDDNKEQFIGDSEENGLEEGLGGLETGNLEGNKVIASRATRDVLHTVYVTSLSFNISHNLLTGQYPMEMAGTALMTVWIDASNNAFTGTIPLLYRVPSVTYLFANNQLSGSFPGTSFLCTTLNLDLSGNSDLIGALPSGLFSTPTNLKLNVSRTRFSGPITTTLPKTSLVIDMSHTEIDFCDSPWTANASLKLTSSTCVLDDTSAACRCPSSYTECSLACPPSYPIFIPVSPPPISGCAAGSQPGPEFTCVNGVWTAPSANVTVLIIPATAGQTVVVSGNVSSSTIVFNGLGTTVVIGGCASNLSSISVELSQEQLKEFGGQKTSLQDLIVLTNGSHCEIDLSGVVINTKAAKGCRKVSTQKVVSDDKATLAAVFTLDSSRCNTWWIVLVSVIAAVIVIVIIIVIARVCWTRHQKMKYTARLESSPATKG